MGRASTQVSEGGADFDALTCNNFRPSPWVTVGHCLHSPRDFGEKPGRAWFGLQKIYEVSNDWLTHRWFCGAVVGSAFSLLICPIHFTVRCQPKTCRASRRCSNCSWTNRPSEAPYRNRGGEPSVATKFPCLLFLASPVDTVGRTHGI